MTADDYLTPEDMAAKFGVSRRRIMEWQHKYQWPCVRVGRTIRWTSQQVEQIAALHAVKAPKVVSDGRTLASRRRSA